MAEFTNLFTIEDAIITQLELIDGLAGFYRDAIDEGINEQNIKTPSVFVISKGILAGQSAVRVKHQKLVTLWEVGLACLREDYKTIGGVKILQIIRQLNGYQADDWINPARLTLETAAERREPLYKGLLAYYPLTFEIEIMG